jgi:TolB-like protein/Tfp pilus assembly protein PilF
MTKRFRLAKPKFESRLPEGERKIAAIMFTDMVGYTALGQRNEALSLALVEEQRSLIRPVLRRHNGREVKTIGDAFLVEFPNAVEAVRCAYDIQRSIREFNLTLEPDKRIHLRIGIHVGEVVVSRGDISGDAVNVASRIEPLAEDGGVCVTRQVYDHVYNKVDLPLSSLGSKTLKNLVAPIEVYKLVMPWSQREASPHVQFDRKRVAVLPLANMSPDPADEYFADGLTEEMIGTLSKIRELSVISRTSVMPYKDKPKPISDISRELNAGTILEGSVRKAGNRARVSIQMIDAAEDKHLWAESYDRDLQDIFFVQSDIAGKVAEALKVELLADEREVIMEAPTKSVEANLLFLKAVNWRDRGSPSDILKSIEYFELATEQDPNFALAYAWAAALYVGVAGEGMPGTEAFPRAKENLERAMALDPKLAEVHSSKGWMEYQFDWKWTEAEDSFRKAIALNPSFAFAHDWYGRMLASLGRFDESISEISRARELDPASPWVMAHLAQVYWMAGMNSEARDMSNKVLETEPSFARAHLYLAFVNAAENKKEDAKREADKAVAIADEAYFRAYQAVVHARVGSTEKAKDILENLQAGRYKGYLSPYFTSAIYYSLGEQDKGYEWMKRAYDDRDPSIPFFNKWPILEAQRKDPRFVEMLHQLKLP